MKNEVFVNKYCKVSLKSGFVLKGVILDADDYGITFETEQATSFLNFDIISDIKVLEE